MSKSINCPFCNHNETYKVAYRYRGHNRKNGDVNYGELIKDGTIYRYEWSHKEKIDFDGEKLKGYLYNKYCPNCEKYFYSVGKMYTIDIIRVTLIYELDNNRFRYDIDFETDGTAMYSFKKDYVTLVNNRKLSNTERYNLLSYIKESKINFWNKEYNGDNNYYWLFKLTYYNGLSALYNGMGGVPNNWEFFIDGFKNLLKTNDENSLYLKLK